MKEMISKEMNTGTNIAEQDPYNTEQWRKRRSEVISRDGGKCQWCGDDGKNGNYLQVHHRQYHHVWENGQSRPKDIWNYEDKYLITLCKSCHEEGHKHFKVPVYDI